MRSIVTSKNVSWPCLIWPTLYASLIFLPNLGTLNLWVLELFAMYATHGQTDGRTDKNNAYCPLPYDSGHNNMNLVHWPLMGWAVTFGTATRELSGAAVPNVTAHPSTAIVPITV